MRSEHKLSYWLIPKSFQARVAQRFTEGAVRYGQYNWQKSVQLRDGQLYVDLGFLRGLYDHAYEHLTAFGHDGNREDDNIGALAWFCAVVSEFESMGVDFYEVFNPHRVASPGFKEL